MLNLFLRRLVRPERASRLAPPLAGPATAAFLVVVVVLMGMAPGVPGQTTAPRDSVIVLDDFEGYETGAFPGQWVYVSQDQNILSYDEVREQGERFVVMERDGNQFVRSRTENEAHRYTLRNGRDGYDWNLGLHPYLRWRWRVVETPDNADETDSDKNDVAAAIYVTFGTDWLGRPRSIKYTYSSTQPVGTVTGYGPLKVIVVDSAREPGLGRWKTELRDVAADYRQVFGGAPPERPVSITLWTDSDNTGSVAEAHFDDLELLATPRARR
jgi:hypothetical protein